jgi:KUP system potassium uptake protein
VFLTIDPDGVPHALLNNLEHNCVLHNRAPLVNVATRQIPWVPPKERVKVTPLVRQCYRFKDEIDLPMALRGYTAQGLPIDTMKVSYFLSRAVVVATGGQGMSLWREKLFSAMSYNMANVAGYLKLQASRVIELGSRVEI